MASVDHPAGQEFNGLAKLPIVVEDVGVEVPMVLISIQRMEVRSENGETNAACAPIQGDEIDVGTVLSNRLALAFRVRPMDRIEWTHL